MGNVTELGKRACCICLRTISLQVSSVHLCKHAWYIFKCILRKNREKIYRKKFDSIDYMILKASMIFETSL